MLKLNWKAFKNLDYVADKKLYIMFTQAKNIFKDN